MKKMESPGDSPFFWLNWAISVYAMSGGKDMDTYHLLHEKAKGWWPESPISEDLRRGQKTGMCSRDLENGA